MKNQRNIPCPCGSGELYEACCKPYHLGKLPHNALNLMRSRYSAYAFCIPEYIIQTTHPASPYFHYDRSDWMKKIVEFCEQTEFKKLEILDFYEKDTFSTVTFTAHLMQNQKDASFTERSYFEKVKGKWLYRTGQFFEGHAPNLLTTSQPRLLPLAYFGDPILRKVAEPIENITEDVKRLVEEMIETMDACQGIGIAAPQVHHSVKIFVIRVPAEEDSREQFLGTKVFINPELSQPSKEICRLEEGCLSIPTIHGEVDRPKEVTVEYLDLNGSRIKERVVGWQARIIQHENDHLNGILFIDHLTEEKKKQLQPFLDHLFNRIHDGTEL